MVTAEQLKAYVQAIDADRDFLQSCVDSAATMVKRHCGARRVPAEILDTAVLEVAANLYQRRVARRDVANFGDAGIVTPLSRPALDPLTPARPILAPFLGVGIA